MTAPLPFRTKADIVYDELRERILSGRLAPGDRVPISRVARELGVSDIPAREGVKRLEADGLLEFATHKGAIVPRMGRHEIEELFAIRAELEALAVRRAAEEITPEQLTELRRILDAMAEAEAARRRRRVRPPEPRVPPRRLRGAVLRAAADDDRLAVGLDGLVPADLLDRHGEPAQLLGRARADLRGARPR